MRKTSVYLDEEQAERLARLARMEGRSKAASSARRSPAIDSDRSGIGALRSPATSSASMAILGRSPQLQMTS
jgi:hypothetical protein